MKARHVGFGLAAPAILGVLCLLLVSGSTAQNRPETGKADAKPIPRLAAATRAIRSFSPRSISFCRLVSEARA